MSRVKTFFNVKEPFERTLLVVVGLIDGDVDQNLEENSLEVAEKITNLNFIMGREFNQTNRKVIPSQFCFKNEHK